MKKYGVLLAIIALLMSSLACQSVMGGGNNNEALETLQTESDGDIEIPTIPPITTDDDGVTTGAKSEFPLPDGAFNVTDLGGTTNFQVKMGLDEAMEFYKDTFTDSGYTERSLLTVTSDTTFSMVFDGHESGKAIVVQGVDLQDGSVNINIRLEEV